MCRTQGSYLRCDRCCLPLGCPACLTECCCVPRTACGSIWTTETQPRAGLAKAHSHVTTTLLCVVHYVLVALQRAHRKSRCGLCGLIHRCCACADPRSGENGKYQIWRRSRNFSGKYRKARAGRDANTPTYHSVRSSRAPAARTALQ